MTKPTKWLCSQQRLRSAWASAQSDQSLRCPHEESLGHQYPLSAQRRLWSDWVDAQADLSLRWAHSHFVGFVMSRLIFTMVVFLILQPPGRGVVLHKFFDLYLSVHVSIQWLRRYEPRNEKTCLRGLRPGKTKTGLLSYSDKQESWNFGYRN